MTEPRSWSKAQRLVGRQRKKALTPRHLSRSLLSRTLSGDSEFSALYTRVTAGLLAASIGLLFASSVESVRVAYPRALNLCDGAISSVFLLDYCARLLTATERSQYGRAGPLVGRLRWMRSWEAIVDVVAALPFFVDVLLPFVELPPLSWVRICRLGRLFKTTTYAAALRTASRILYVNREILLVALTLVSLMIFVTAALLFVSASADDECSAKNGLDTLPGAMFAAVMMLTGLGSPEGDLNVSLRLVTVLTAFLSVPFFAVPAAMLTWGFEGEAARLAAHERRRFRKRQVYGEAEASSSSEEDEGEEELGEYLDGVGGGEEAEAEGAEEEALAFFARAQEGSSLLPTCQRLAIRLGVRRLDAARKAQLEQDALALVHRVGAASAAGLSADAAERLEKRLQAFAETARRVASSAGADRGSGREEAPAQDAVDPGELRGEVQRLRGELARVLELVERIDERQRGGGSL